MAQGMKEGIEIKRKGKAADEARQIAEAKKVASKFG